MAHSWRPTRVMNHSSHIYALLFPARYAVDEVQGNLLSRPVTAGEIEALMQDSLTLVLPGENVVQMPTNTKARAN